MWPVGWAGLISAEFDHVIAMDGNNLRNLRALMPANATAQLGLLLDHLPGSEGQSVADPYYGEAADFEACWRQVEVATRRLAETLY
jgi:protein-tyrosine phosphatase